MPIYEYRCDDCDALVEVLQKMSDDPLEVCDRCGGHLRKVLHPVAIHFKGSGFYTTDYGRGSGSRPAKEGAESTSAAETSTSGDGDAGKAKATKSAGAAESAGKPSKQKAASTP